MTFWVAVSSRRDGEASLFIVVWPPGRARHRIAEQSIPFVAIVRSREPAPGAIAALSNKAEERRNTSGDDC